MDKIVAKMANQAVFQLQFNTRDAIRYVMRNSRADHDMAREAIRSTILFYKK